jgi:hypothetical protein
VKFAHISPKSFQEFAAQKSGIHLTLAHLVEQQGESYNNQFQDGKPIILDNSAFEMYKQQRPMYPSDKLLHMAGQINADYIVMSDYPGEPGQKTIDAAIKLGPIFKEAGYKTFFVPQSKIGDLQDYIATFKWALEQDWIDLIGVSILGVPNAYGVEKDNNLQRFLSRWYMLKVLESKNILDPNNEKHMNKLHFLGMVDGPNEIDLVEKYHDYIYSWDTSAAVWAGVNDITFDDTPTGLINGKCEIEVDFSCNNDVNFNKVKFNIEYINNKEGVQI